MTTRPNIATRYAPHAGSNVGDYVASAVVGRGRRVTAQVRADQSLSSHANHRAAATKLAAKLELSLGFELGASSRGHRFSTRELES